VVPILGPLPAVTVDGPPVTGGFGWTLPLLSPELPPIVAEEPAAFVLPLVVALGPEGGGAVGAGESESDA
jgi:hypothetical protein